LNTTYPELLRVHWICLPVKIYLNSLHISLQIFMFRKMLSLPI